MFKNDINNYTMYILLVNKYLFTNRALQYEPWYIYVQNTIINYKYIYESTNIAGSQHACAQNASYMRSDFKEIKRGNRTCTL